MPAPGQRRALIAGASGAVGSVLLAQLLAEQAYAEIHALVRRPLPMPASVKAGRLVQHAFDLSAAGGVEDMTGIDDVYICLGTTIRNAGSQAAFRSVDFDAVVKVAHLGRQFGASRLAAVSALGADSGSSVFYNRVKGEAEAQLIGSGYESITILRPSLLDAQRIEVRPAERLSLALTRPIAWLIPARWRPVSVRAVARCMVDAVLQGDAGVRIIESDRIQRFAG
jgi:uncharacterized protein YbjT (DUF2867 family)